MTVSVVLRTLTFPAPARLLNLNDRMHWAAKGRLVKEWRNATAWRALEMFPRASSEPLPPSIIDIALPVRVRRRIDPSNLSMTSKCIVDGLVDAGWWSDDSSEFVTVLEPSIVVGGPVTITARARP